VEKVLTVREAATALKVHEKTIIRWIREGRIRATRPGRAWRVPESEVAKLLDPDKGG
jgi:excisionase family DNA binding protein